MKLNTKRTLCVGFAFFLICLFWQAYDTLVPKILCDKFGLSQTVSGAIMALDNILALFMLPFFGALSDKTHTKFGRRTPYIVVGTVAAAIFFVVLSFADKMQLVALGNIGYDDPNLAEKALAVTLANPAIIIFFMVMLLLVLMSMSIFRSPAVALMPDVTVKPLRSKANAIINLMGAAGGILVLVLGIVMKTGAVENRLMSYTLFFSIVAILMIVCLGIFLFTVNEPKFVREMEEESARLGITDSEPENAGSGKMSKEKLVSLLLILASVALWYIGYNAVTSKYSVYAGEVLKQDYNLTLIIAQAAAIISYIPIGILSQKFGRKKTILAGVSILFTAFLAASFLREGSPAFLMYILFILAGFGWAAINVNSFPMVVELASGADVGRYTGFYYTASMAAQVLTPILSGAFMDVTGTMTVLFPYAAFFVAASFVTMMFVRHGDAKVALKSDMLENFDVGD